MLGQSGGRLDLEPQVLQWRALPTSVVAQKLEARSARVQE